ncbi:hypothetical protein TanjilG_21373 [Lupinus angustifolius]|uniref:Uncharacterized protein n=1 Tax=Lupinus angustifolius TaxID=3871 RepID=A0A4P1RMN7_LUPAN|nr:hypothetical protein TanjilG_21373 [Lupinus angustifolius]
MHQMHIRQPRLEWSHQMHMCQSQSLHQMRMHMRQPRSEWLHQMHMCKSRSLHQTRMGNEHQLSLSRSGQGMALVGSVSVRTGLGALVGSASFRTGLGAPIDVSVRQGHGASSQPWQYLLKSDSSSQ